MNNYFLNDILYLLPEIFFIFSIIVILVYSILCEELGLKNSKIRLKYKTYINNKALRKKIKFAKK